MKGMLIKDFKLLRNMRNSLIIIVLVAVTSGAYLQDASFVIPYLAFIGATFASSTLSYDEYDNGYAYLLSMPVTRKGYVTEKYILGFILGGGGWLAGAVISVAAGMVRHTADPADTMMMALLLLPVPLIFLSLLLPFYLKFGGEKGRIIMVATIGVMFALFAVGTKLAKKMNISLDGLIEGIFVMSTGMAVLCAIAVGIAVTILSFRISIGIMGKKEF